MMKMMKMTSDKSSFFQLPLNYQLYVGGSTKWAFPVMELII